MPAEGARRELVDRHLGLLRAVAAQVRRQVSTRLELDELVAWGAEGLIEAADRFDERRGASFATYAVHRVRGAIYDGLRRMGQLPRAVYARARAAERAHEYLHSVAERERGAAASAGPGAPPPTREEDLEALLGALEGVAATYLVSMEAAAATGLELVDEGPGADDVVGLRQLGGRVRAALAALPDKERHFIEKHYFEGKTLAEAGAELGLSRSWASRLHARAVDLLRARLLAG